jgi:hypothetical protein
VQHKATELKGSSAGHLPSQVSKKKLPTKSQKTKRATGEKLKPLKRTFLLETENINKNNTESRRAKTPPNLLGIERKIA